MRDELDPGTARHTKMEDFSNEGLWGHQGQESVWGAYLNIQN